MVNNLIAWYVTLPWAAALLFMFSSFGAAAILILAFDGWRQGAELRAIRRRIRKAVKEKHRRFVSNKEMADRRIEWSPKATRAFMLAMRDQKTRRTNAQ